LIHSTDEKLFRLDSEKSDIDAGSHVFKNVSVSYNWACIMEINSDQNYSIFSPENTIEI